MNLMSVQRFGDRGKRVCQRRSCRICSDLLGTLLHQRGWDVLPIPPAVANDNPRCPRRVRHDPDILLLLQRRLVPRAIQVRLALGWREEGEGRCEGGR